MKQKHIKLSIHFEHSTRDLSIICELLKLRPAHIWKNGDERRTPKGTKIGGVRHNSYCSIDWNAFPGTSLVNQIKDVLKILNPHREILREIVSDGGFICLNIATFFDEHYAERLDWSILHDISDLRLSIDLNIYAPDPPDAEIEMA